MRQCSKFKICINWDSIFWDSRFVIGATREGLGNRKNWDSIIWDTLTIEPYYFQSF